MNGVSSEMKKDFEGTLFPPPPLQEGLIYGWKTADEDGPELTRG